MSDAPEPLAPPMADSSGSKAKGPAKKRGKKGKKKRSSRGASSFFRNAYRTQLDLTQLADNKASIMISVNGFILSVTLASGGVLLGSRSRILLPLIVLLVGCLGSMIYAILAARPRSAGKSRSSVEPGNVLFHETTGGLSEDDYSAEVERLLRDETRSNEEMARHLHGLGRVLIRKFRLLRISYTIFIVGLTASILAFFAVAAGVAFPAIPEEIVPESLTDSRPVGQIADLRFSGVYEPSGAVVLDDGSVLLVEDEEDRPFTLGTLGSDGRWREETPLDPGAELDDLEALARDDAGRIYAIGSHSRSDSGRPRPKRAVLARFSVKDGRLADLRVLADLASPLAASALGLPPGEAEARIRVLRPGLDVEGMAWDADGDRLLIGLRSPLAGNRAVVVPLRARDSAFDGTEPAEVGPRILLDLEGDGIRAMAADPATDGYLLVSGPAGPPNRPFRLWHWVGPPATEVRPVRGVDLPARVEGLARVMTDDGEALLFVVDDGSLEDERPASYLLVPRGALSLEAR